MARQVFISYSQSDRDCAFEMVAHLESRGIECWVAPRDIAPSADWAAEIMDAISAARVMILVFSASSNDSPQVRREVERAVHKQLSILPFRIENVLPSKSLEFFLSTQHWMDAYTPPRDAHYARLGAYLQTQLAAPFRTSETGSNPIPSYAGAGAPPPPSAPAIDTSRLQHIERQLAGYVGPLAKHLVKVAAARSAGVDDLVGRLATELDSDSERREFTQRCRMGPM
jgi:hypothetical protein